MWFEERCLNNVHIREGFITPERPSLGAKTITFQRSCGAFRLMWSEGIVIAHAGECWGQGGVCMVWVCVRGAVRVTWQGYISQRAAGPDVWLPLTVHSRRGWLFAGPTPSPPFPPGQKPWPSWKMWIQRLLCLKPRDMPSEKSDLCWKSDGVFEVLFLAVWGKK